MSLQPLKQWICDHCGEVIESAEQGCVEWLVDAKEERYNNYGFKIVHHAAYSPRKPQGNCYHYQKTEVHILWCDASLTDFTGERGIIQLLMLIDIGPYRDKEYRGPLAKNFREWTELVRRLMIPYYEEARFCMSRADADGFFDGANEIYIYLPDTLKEIIKLYSHA